MAGMGPFTEDEFLVALDDLHSPEIGVKKLVVAMKKAYPQREGVNAKAVREALQVLRSADGVARVASARARVPNVAPKDEPEDPVDSPPKEPEETEEELGDDEKLFMTTQKEPREFAVAATPVPQPVFEENNDPPAQDEGEDFSSDDEGTYLTLCCRDTLSLLSSSHASAANASRAFWRL